MQRTRKQYLAPVVLAALLASLVIPVPMAQAGWTSRAGHGFVGEQICRDGIRFGLGADDFLDDYGVVVFADRNTRRWNGDEKVVARREVFLPEADPAVAADFGADHPDPIGFKSFGHAAFFTLRWSELLDPGTKLRMRVEEALHSHDPTDAIPDDENIVTVRDCRLVNFIFSMSDSPDPVEVGDTLTYMYNVSNGVSTSAVSTRTFATTDSIGIVDGGAASPYPSTVTVAGLVGRVTKVEVTLQNVFHPVPADLDLLLVGPNGRAVLLMSDAAGNPDVNFESVTFDDAADAKVPHADTNIGAARWRPANYGAAADVFPGPAPAPPYAVSLSTFNGATPNGTWSLYVVDDTSANESGGQAISGGWALTVSTDRVPYRLTVQDRLPAGSTFLSFAGHGWRCASDASTSEPLVTCSRNVAAPQRVPALQIRLRAPRTTGHLANSANLTAIDTSTFLSIPDTIRRRATVRTLVNP